MRHMHRHVPALALIVAMFLGCIVLAPACSGSQRQKTLHASVIALNASRDALLTYDEHHQQDLVAKATSREEAEAAVAAYHARRAVVSTALEVAYRAVALAATANDDPSYRAALDAGRAALDAVKSLIGGP